MNIQENISKDIKEAMKAKQSDVVTALRGLQASLKNRSIELKRDLDDSETMDILKTTTKQLKDAMGDFVKAEREDLVQKTKAELALISQYLPTPMEREEIKKHVVKAATEVGATTMQDMGKLMGAVMKAAGAAANGDDVRQEVEAYLKEQG